MALKAIGYRFESDWAHRAEVMQLADMAASKTASCGFDSHLPHQRWTGGAIWQTPIVENDSFAGSTPALSTRSAVVG